MHIWDHLGFDPGDDGKRLQRDSSALGLCKSVLSSEPDYVEGPADPHMSFRFCQVFCCTQTFLISRGMGHLSYPAWVMECEPRKPTNPQRSTSFRFL